MASGRNVRLGPASAGHPPRQEAALAGAVTARAARIVTAYARARARCGASMSRGNVHDLRVATRRLEALLDLFPAVARRHGDVRQTLAGTFRVAGRLRDVQLFLRALKAGEPGPAPAHLHAALRTRRDKLRARLAVELVRAKTAMPDVALRDVAGALRAHAGAAAGAGRLAKGMRGRLRVLRDGHARALGRVAPDDARSVHAVRLALKRLRYAAEFAGPLLPAADIPDPAALADQQSFLGALSDRRAWLELVERQIRRHPRRQRTLQPLREQLECDVAARLARIGTLGAPEARVSHRSARAAS